MDMKNKLDEFHAYRFYERKEGPLSSIRNLTFKEALERGQQCGIRNMEDIYYNRVDIENLLYKMFINKGGKPQTEYPYYAAIYNELPKDNKLFVRFNEPDCIKIPLNAFPKDCVSFTYGRSPKALTRKDGHPTRRKLYLWDEAEWVINNIQFVEDEELWLEMQIWERNTLSQYYNNGKGKCIKSYEVDGRITEIDRMAITEKYSTQFELIKAEYFLEPFSPHGVSHAQRVLILSNELADLYNINEKYKEVLTYCAAYHDIGRVNQVVDDSHGFTSYEKIKDLNLIPKTVDITSQKIIRFIIEYHQLDNMVAKDNLEKLYIENKELTYKLYCIFKDADTLDRCRYGQVVQSFLNNKDSKIMIYFAYQLLSFIR